MSGKTKILFTEQTKLSQLNLGQLELLLGNNESNVYVDSDNFLRIAEKTNDIVSEKNPVSDIIESINIDNIPPDPTELNSDEGYALMAVRDGSDYKIIWGLMDTLGNYNVISGNTVYTITFNSPRFQIFDVQTPGDYDFNGNILINVTGDGANAAKKYSIDGGSTFTSLNSTPTFNFPRLGSLTGETYNLVIRDKGNKTLYTQTINLLPPDYSFDFIDSGLYTPSNITHLIYKTDDYNPTNPSEIEVIVDDDVTELPGLYKYSIYSGTTTGATTVLISETQFIPDKNTIFPIQPLQQPNTVYSAQVSRINAGYIELGEWSSPTNQNIYLPPNFRWSKNNGVTFLIPSFISQPMILQGMGNTVRVNYTVDEIGELGGDKKIFMRRLASNEVYQSTYSLIQVSTPSLAQPSIISPLLTNEVIINETEGVVTDQFFNSLFNSDIYRVPTIVQSVGPEWFGNDFRFNVQFSSTVFVGNPNTELTMLVEDLTGDFITTETATLISANILTGLTYRFDIVDFRTTISPYLGRIVRVRFTFNPDTLVNTPNNYFLSKLKYVRYV
jgi:hypothetical protein